MLNSAADVAAFIRDSVGYKPGFRLVATPSSNAAACFVDLTYRAPDTAPGNQGDRDVYALPLTIGVGDDGVTETAVIAQVAAWLVSVETHEVREFLTVDGVAPYHPHLTREREPWRDVANELVGRGLHNLGA